MAKRKKINTKELVEKIEKLTQKRIAEEKVVSLSDYRDLRRKDKFNILVVEDDAVMRRALKKIFENQGYSVLCAASGAEIASVVDGEIIDLIVLDVELPWINGLELAYLMKQSPDLKEIPLIFVSGRGKEEDIRLGFEAGADDYIRKPFDVEYICKTVRTLLKLSS